MYLKYCVGTWLVDGIGDPLLVFESITVDYGTLIITRIEADSYRVEYVPYVDSTDTRPHVVIEYKSLESMLHGLMRNCSDMKGFIKHGTDPFKICPNCGCEIARCGPELWKFQRKCCPDCKHKVGPASGE